VGKVIIGNRNCEYVSVHEILEKKPGYWTNDSTKMRNENETENINIINTEKDKYYDK